MKKIYIVGSVLLLVAVGFLVYSKVVKPQLDNRMVTAVVPATIENKELDFAFTFPSGEAGYTTVEPPVATTTSDGIQKIYLILNTAEYITFQSTAAGAEAPKLISVFVIALPETPDGVETPDRVTILRNWAEQTPQMSSFSLKTTEPEALEIDGVKTLRYQTEGTYKQEVYLAYHKGRIYVFTGQYVEESDDIRSTFKNLINSLTFY